MVAVLKRIKPEDAESTDVVFQTEPTTRTLAADLKRAGIAEYDAEGRRVDRHALRTTTGSLLARAEVPVQQARLQMRHAEISTTIRHYTDLGLADQARAVARIPRIVIPTLRLTGTDGPLLTTPNDRQHQCQQTVNETTRAVTKGNDATRDSTEVVKIKSAQEITRVSSMTTVYRCAYQCDFHRLHPKDRDRDDVWR